MSSIEPDESQDYRGNSALLSEGVSASDPCLSPRPPLLPSARPGHKPRRCPPLTLRSATMSVSSHLPLLPLSLVTSAPSWNDRTLLMDHGLQRHIDTHRADLCDHGETLIKGINQQNVSIKMRNAIISARLDFITAHMKNVQ